MTTAAKSARPPWSVVCWADDTAIYTEIPATSGPPLIQRYALTEGGLSKALEFLRAFHRQYQPTGGDYKITLQANIKRPGIAGTDAQREQARAILKRLKIT